MAQTRYYWHGDLVEGGESELYYCAFCDSFEGQEHFDSQAEHDHVKRGTHFDRLKRSKNATFSDQFYRPKNALNLFE